jgi:pSer/pThr/pTyr-binding forkhead associated (FHA) protein
VVERDGSDGPVFALRGERVQVGRTQGDVRFPHDPFVSPVHATLARVPTGGWTVTDVGSRNGIYLRIARSEPVYPGDMFLVGHQLLRLENAPRAEGEAPDAHGTAPFGTPADPAWGRVSRHVRGVGAADVYHLRSSEVVFGRESGDVLFPHDGFLSRQHARLRLELRGGAMAVFLEDLGSANGTFLRVRGQAHLGAGDVMRIGDQVLALRVDGAP